MDTTKETAAHESPKRSSGRPRTFSGVVVSDKMKDSVVVAVARYVKHPKYKKYIRRVKRYVADDKSNTHSVGERVTIEECRPISKTKRFKIAAK